MDDVKARLFPYQIDGVRRIVELRGRALLFDEPGLGKAQPIDARVLTPNGWEEIGNVYVGDLVAGSDGNFHSVLGVYPQGERDIYEVLFSDGSKTRCCDGHLWNVRARRDRISGLGFRTLALRDMISGITRSDGGKQYLIPMVKPIQFAQRELVVDPYLLGLLLGDGCLRRSTPSFSTADDELLSSLKALLPDGITAKHGGRVDYRLSGKTWVTNPLAQKIKSLGLLGTSSSTKFIPECYLYSSPEDRVALLQGLMDTDGFVDKTGFVVQYTTISRQLADGVTFLVQSLGGVARRSSKVPRGGQLAYTLTLSFPPECVPFRLTRKVARYVPRSKYPPARFVKRIEKVGRSECVCIRVRAPDHLYVTDEFIVTHNTAQTIIAAHVLRAWPLVVACPSGLVLNWRDEVLSWLAGRIEPHEVTVVKNGRAHLAGRVLLVSHKLAAKRAQELREFRPRMVAVDEAHVIKEVKAKVTKALVPICASAPGCILATGTPILNRPVELYPLLQAVRFPGLEPWFSFAMRYGNGRQKEIGKRLVLNDETKQWERISKYAWDFKGSSNLEELNERLRPHMIRRLRRDVLQDLPECNRTRMTVESSEAKARNAAVRDACNDFFAENPDGAEGPPPSLLESYRLLGESKVEAAVEWLHHNVTADSPVVVFAHHLGVIASIASGCSEARLRTTTITGAIPLAERHEIVRAFQSGAIDVLVCGITAASTGITLTRGSMMLAVELPWSPKIAEQMEARLRRIGQTQKVLARYMVAEGTYDEDIWGMLIRKSRASDVAIDGGSGERFGADGNETVTKII